MIPILDLKRQYDQIGKEIESANAEIDKYESEYQIARESQAAEQAAVRSKELEYNRIDEAFYREKQVQNWSHEKKMALIESDSNMLRKLAECRNETHWKNK